MPNWKIQFSTGIANANKLRMKGLVDKWMWQFVMFCQQNEWQRRGEKKGINQQCFGEIDILTHENNEEWDGRRRRRWEEVRKDGMSKARIALSRKERQEEPYKDSVAEDREQMCSVKRD